MANRLSEYANDVRIVPTAVDIEHYLPKSKPLNGNNFVVGWIGTWGNLKYLDMIEEALGYFLKQKKDAELLIISDRSPRLSKVNTSQVRYIPWSVQNEVKNIQEMNVGLMPLSDDEWTRGKCSLKMLQYMACGVPVIVSPVGMNKDVLSIDEVGLPAATKTEWFDALKFYYSEREDARRLGKNGRAVVEKYYSRQVISKKLASIFRELI